MRPSTNTVHIPSPDWEKTQKGNVPPQAAQNAAKRVLEWRDKYGDEVQGMTRVGWTRANQLASGASLSDDVISRMAQFARHRQNYEAAQRNYKQDQVAYKAGRKTKAPKPWHYAGIVAWLGWGGSSGVAWAGRQSAKPKQMTKGQTGAMVALYPDLETSQMLTVPGGLPAEEIHLTLAYLGEAESIGDPLPLLNTVGELARQLPPLTAQAGGIGIFEKTNSQGYKPFYVTVDTPELPEFRRQVWEAVKEALNLDSEFGFVPHMTLKYMNGRRPPFEVPHIPIEFDKISVVLAGNRIDFPLRGQVQKAWVSPESNLSAEDYAKVSLIDLNEPGEKKVKSKIKLPYKSTPNGPVNPDAVRAAVSRFPQMKDVPAEVKRQAARKLVRLMREVGMEPGEGILAEAGIRKIDIDITKADEEKRLVYGVVLQPDIADAEGDEIEPGDIEATAHDYMLKSQRYDLQHEEIIERDKVRVVESYITPAEFEMGNRTIRKGSWIVVSKIMDDDLWKDVKTGKIGAYSIMGTGRRQAVA